MDALAILQQALYYDDDRPRKIKFHEPATSNVREIPRRTPRQNVALFYQREDFALFQAKEQQRYDKMMMKRIQEMVTEAMKDELEEAYARNATPEEIDAMMPQTTEAIFELLGGIPTMDMMKPPSANMHQEQMTKSKAVDDNPGNDHQDDNLGNLPQSTDEVEPNDQASSSSRSDGVVEANTNEEILDLPCLHPGEADEPDVQERCDEPEIPVEGNTVEEMLALFGLDSGEAANDNASEGSENVDVVKQQKFHLGNDDPTEIDIYNKIEKNDAVNDVLGTSFSSEVHLEDLVPLSPKNSPRHSPVRSPKGKPFIPMVNLDEDLFLESSP